MNGFNIIDIVRNTNVQNEYSKYKSLIFNQSDNAELLLKIQESNLTQFILQLRKNNFYCRLLKSIDDASIKYNPKEVLNELPIIDKDTINNNYSMFKTKWALSEVNYTGGSTGSPFHYILDKRSISKMRAFNYFLWNAFLDYEFGDKIIVVAGGSLGNNFSFKNKVYNYLQNKEYISGGFISESNTKSLAYLINRQKEPFVIYGYPSSIEQYLRISIEKGYNLKSNLLKGIICTSEMLYDETKDFIERSLKTKILNIYGANDGGILAASLDNKAFYYNGIDCYAENIVVDGFPEIVLTNLFSFAFPFVRYRVGDLGEITNQNHEYPFLIKGLIGRSRDFIKVNENTKIHGSAINKVLKEFEFIKQYQVEQFEDLTCIIRLVTEKTGNNKNIEDKVRNNFSKILHSCLFKIEFVDSLPPKKNGKLQNIISHVP